MNWQAISANPFFTVALPLIPTLIGTTWAAVHKTDGLHKRIDDLRDSINKRFDGVDRRLDKVDVRLDRIEAKLDGHAERIAKLEGPALIRQ